MLLSFLPFTDWGRVADGKGGGGRTGWGGQDVALHPGAGGEPVHHGARTRAPRVLHGVEAVLVDSADGAHEARPHGGDPTPAPRLGGGHREDQEVAHCDLPQVHLPVHVPPHDEAPVQLVPSGGLPPECELGALGPVREGGLGRHVGLCGRARLGG